jgi:hypothetical protein
MTEYFPTQNKPAFFCRKFHRPNKQGVLVQGVRMSAKPTLWLSEPVLERLARC